ncbi:MAG: DUF2378 family protein [Chloroflexi bacterium]|nr:DUF2378 family protein [Chloroflexota bacterium]OJV94453.1 MAG: hypothetical protein BGO39_22110 [Chloroflexi bacterium 54-19]
MLNTSREVAITGNSIKALFTGLKLADKPVIFQETLDRFNVTYPNIGSSFPFDRYLEMVDWLRRQLFPFKSEAAGFEQIGRAVTRGFFEGAAGSVLKMSIKVMGAQRSVPLFFRVAGGAVPFGRFEVVENKPRYIRAILYNVPGSPEIMRGMSLEAMEATASKNPTVTYKKLNPDDTEFVARWLD